MADGAPRIAVVTANANASNSYTLDWLEAFLESPLLLATHIDLLRPGSSHRLRRALREVDATVILHSVTTDDLQPLRNVVNTFSDRRGPVCLLVGNEINLPWAPMSEKISLMDQMHVEIVGTQLLLDAGRALYGSLSATQVVSIPHAVDTSRLVYSAPRQSANLTLGTRSAKYLPILGDTERERFFTAVRETGHSRGWEIDIDASRLSRTAWQRYLAGVDAAPGTEAGSWYTSPSDEVVAAILRDARRSFGGVSIRVDGRTRRLARYLPWQLRAWLRRNSGSKVLSNDLDLLAHLDPEETVKRFFEPVDRPAAYMKAASSRHFECAALGTTQLLLTGRYNDIFKPGKHFVEVSSDHGNLGEALDMLLELPARISMSAESRQLIEDHHTLNHRIRAILEVLLSSISIC
jgi:hypothetical protein